MPKVNITIDGKPIQAEAGSTVLQAARAAGIDIPTLCDHPALQPVGNCRMCLVEIERQRTLQAACVFPISEGMVVHTESPKVAVARRFVLELILSDHAFYCMYCEMSGDCELQKLAYRYGIDKVPYPYHYPWEPVDASREYFVFDPKRCILCRRCVRACHEIVGNDTLGIKARGFESRIIADLDVPFGQSSCISCGTCLQVCPTGALTDRRSSYMGRATETAKTKSICAACSIGCGIEVVTRTNNLIRIDGDWEAEVNHGLLCILGRFQQLDQKRERYLAPLIRRGGELRAASWEEALGLVAKKLKQAAKGKMLGLVSPRATNETLQRFRDLMQKLGSTNIGTFVGTFPEFPAGAKEGDLKDMLEADFILLAGSDLTKDHQVVASFVKCALAKGAHLVIVDDQENGLEEYARFAFKPEETEKAVELGERAQKAVVLYGSRAQEKTLKALGKLAGKAAFVKLIPGTNARGAYDLGFGSANAGAIQAALVWASDDGAAISAGLLEALKKVDFVAVQAAYPSPLSDIADVILPATIWAEKEGSLTSTTGRVQKMVKVLQACEGIMEDEAILQALAERL